jgi:catechol 2,3-dioxygenase-like lactoylglutathione lyase family enzyme
VPELQGFSHVDLTVSDCEAAAAWWQDVMGFTLVNRSRGETFEVWSLIHPTGVAVSVVAHDVPLSEPLMNGASVLIA